MKREKFLLWKVKPAPGRSKWKEKEIGSSTQVTGHHAMDYPRHSWGKGKWKEEDLACVTWGEKKNKCLLETFLKKKRETWRRKVKERKKWTRINQKAWLLQPRSMDQKRMHTHWRIELNADVVIGNSIPKRRGLNWSNS